MTPRSLFLQMASDDVVRRLVDRDFGFVHPMEHGDNPSIYTMLYRNGWVYLENDQRGGRYYKYELSGCFDALHDAYRNRLINSDEFHQYFDVLSDLMDGRVFPKPFFLWNFDMDIMLTLDSFIMMYSASRERVHEIPHLEIDFDGSVGTIDVYSINAVDAFDYDSSDDDVFVGMEPIVVDMFSMVLDLESADIDDLTTTSEGY